VLKYCKNCGAKIGDTFDSCNICGETERLIPTFGTKAGAFGKALLYVFCFLFFQAAVSLAYSIYYGIMAGAGAYGDITEAELLKMVNSHLSEVFIISAALTVVFFCIVFAIRKKSLVKRIKSNVSPGGVGILVVMLGAVLNYITVIISSFLPISDEVLNQHEETYSAMGEGSPMLVLLAVVALAPIVEELVFRALAFGTMRKVMPLGAAIAISALVFGISHGTAISFVYATVLGALLAYFYEISGSFWVPVLLHFGFNFGSLLVALTPEGSLILYALILFAATVLAVMLGAVCIVYYTKRQVKTAEN